MPQFHERLKETFGRHAEALAYPAKVLCDLHTELRNRFPLCHTETDEIADRLIEVAVKIETLHVRVTPPAPLKMPEPTPSPQAEGEPAS